MTGFKPVSQIMSQVRKGAIRGLEDAAEAVAEQSDKNAPKDTGGLVESRRISIEQRGGNLVAGIHYGEGLPDPRAVINHEKTEIHHDQGGPKYLERALAAEREPVARALAKQISKEIH